MKSIKMLKNILIKKLVVGQREVAEVCISSKEVVNTDNQEETEKLNIFWNEVNKCINENSENNINKICNKYNGKNKYAVCKETIQNYEKKINELEVNYDIKNVCTMGCAACCYHLIGINSYEKDIIKKAIFKLTSGERERIKNRATHIVEVLDKERINV